MNQRHAVTDSGATDAMNDDPISENEDRVATYLEYQWLSGIPDLLRKARQRSGLTQEEVAKALGTTQSAIARWERSTDGSVSVRNVLRFLRACQAMPMKVEAFPEADVIRFSQNRLHTPALAEEFREWQLTENNDQLTAELRTVSGRDDAPMISEQPCAEVPNWNSSGRRRTRPRNAQKSQLSRLGVNSSVGADTVAHGEDRTVA